MSKKEDIRDYLSIIGRKGGQKSKRKLSPEQARGMVLARIAKAKLRAKLLPESEK
jgi:hypothetical protein